MSTNLKFLLMAVIVTAIIVVLVALYSCPLYPGFGSLEGVAFWTAVTLVASASPVPMPRGTFISVSIAPILATAALGGPAAAAVVAAIGTTEWREASGRVPWYGTLYNHAELVIPAVLAAWVFAVVNGPQFRPGLLSLAAMGLAGIVYFAVNVGLASASIALRHHKSPMTVLANDIRMVGGNLLGMAPLAWLIALSWQVAWWSTLVFALPLYTNRAAYAQAAAIREMFTQTIKALATAIDARDEFTMLHSDRVQCMAVDVGRELRCSEEELEALEWGGLLHDIGKIGVADEVLLKKNRLTREERVLMNRHPQTGEDIIRPVTQLEGVLPLIRHHHEWYNGSGYPDHEQGEGIPKLARILHVADAFEAMTAARPYRTVPLTAEQALAELRRFAGIQFDPAVVEAFARTTWVAGVPDPGKATPRLPPVPLLAQAAALRARPADSGDVAPQDAG